MFESLYDLLMSDVDYERLFESIEPYLKKDDLIIDAGCGSGYFLVECLKKGYHAIGIDLSSSMLAIAKNRLHDEHLVTALYEHDLRCPLYAKADVILGMFDVFNYFKGIKKVFNNMYQALYPGGRFIFDLYKVDVLSTYDGYVEEEHEPMWYKWNIQIHHQMMIHRVYHQHDVDIIKQYVYPLSYYVDHLEKLGFEVLVKEGIDPRKWMLICTKKLS